MTEKIKIYVLWGMFGDGGWIPNRILNMTARQQWEENEITIKELGSFSDHIVDSHIRYQLKPGNYSLH